MPSPRRNEAKTVFGQVEHAGQLPEAEARCGRFCPQYFYPFMFHLSLSGLSEEDCISVLEARAEKLRHVTVRPSKEVQNRGTGDIKDEIAGPGLQFNYM